MPLNFVNPYSGEEEETCSVSFAAQQEMVGGVSSPQTEAQFNQSKLLGEWGVIKAKYAKGEMAANIKVLTFTTSTGRGYLTTKPGTSKKFQFVKFDNSGKKSTYPVDPDFGDDLIKAPVYQVAIPQAVSAKPKPEPVKVVYGEPGFTESIKPSLTHGQVVAVGGGGYIKWNGVTKKFVFWGKDANTGVVTAQFGSAFLSSVMDDEVSWFKPDGKDTTSPATPETTSPPTSPPAQVAAPTPTPAVNPGSTSVGSMSHEDVAAMFVKIKDDLAKEQGLNIKGANPALDAVVYDKIGAATGYTAAEVKAKIEAYKAQGHKLSALKKKVLAGTKQVPEGKPTPAKQDAPSGPLADPPGNKTVMTKKAWEEIWENAKAGKYEPGTKVLEFSNAKGDTGWVAYSGGQLTTYILSPGKTPFKTKTQKIVIDGWVKSPGVEVKNLNAKEHTPDPKPNGVPTVATPAVAEAIKTEVKQEAAADPAKVYSDEDVAAAYIIAKDKIVAESNGKWTLYTKSDELDLEIAIAVGLKTGLNPTQQKQAIANYLASGKKLSVLKKQLIKSGAMTAQADTLKKGAAAKTQAEKEQEAAEKAEVGYTPTPTPTSTATPPQDTGVEPTKKEQDKAEEKGDISGISDNLKKTYFDKFKALGSKSYLSSSTGLNYEGLLQVQKEMQLFGHSKNLTLLQLVRVIDEYGANKAGVENGHLFEKKVITWLTTPDGTAYIKAQEKKLAEQAEQEKKKAEAAKLAKELEDKQPPLPADSSTFQEMTPAKALRFQQQQLAKKPFGPGEKEGMRVYTGGTYREMNAYLRGLSTNISPANKKHIENAKKGFRPAPEPMLLRRGTGANQFQTLGVQRGDTSLLWGLTGKTFEDKGFLSTSAAGRAAFGGEVALEIELPEGAPCMWVDNFSQHPGENEMLLPPGMQFKILNVRKEGGTFVMRIRAVGWPGK
jgi:hypothetical protein